MCVCVSFSLSLVSWTHSPDNPFPLSFSVIDFHLAHWITLRLSTLSLRRCMGLSLVLKDFFCFFFSLFFYCFCHVFLQVCTAAFCVFPSLFWTVLDLKQAMSWRPVSKEWSKWGTWKKEKKKAQYHGEEMHKSKSHQTATHRGSESESTVLSLAELQRTSKIN